MPIWKQNSGFGSIPWWIFGILKTEKPQILKEIIQRDQNPWPIKLNEVNYPTLISKVNKTLIRMQSLLASLWSLHVYLHVSLQGGPFLKTFG